MKIKKIILTIIITLGLIQLVDLALYAESTAHVQIKNDTLYIDGKVQPFLYCAETQYFRARGSGLKNAPAKLTYQAWDKLLNKVKEADMNAVGFYIPWDFHEPKEGIFDFTGTYDGDGDGRPDYPARNIIKFIQMVKERGINIIIVRPGPYINAEWGYTGFGAVPEWFSKKYPESLMKKSDGSFSNHPAYNNPVFLEYTRNWFEHLYREVLKNNIRPDKPIIFLQLDNETNYFWKGVYDLDYSQHAINWYHKFLREKYNNDINFLNQAYNLKAILGKRPYRNFDDVLPPKDESNEAKRFLLSYDWYEYHDWYIYQYFKKLRKMWENIGVKEPDVLFIGCDSFNAPDYGLLAGWHYQNQPGETCLSVMNEYPKISESAETCLMNWPMKPSFDTKVFDEVTDLYLGKNEWVFGTEIQGGWFPPTEVTNKERAQVYTACVGHGMKGLSIYYFHEGYNWDGSDLHFDAPLDKNLEEQNGYKVVKRFGNNLFGPHGSELADSQEVEDSVAIVQYLPYHYLGRGAFVSTFSAGALFGLLLDSGYNPDVIYLDWANLDNLTKYKILFFQDLGYMKNEDMQKLKAYVANGGTLINLLNEASWDLKGQPLDVLKKSILPARLKGIETKQEKLKFKLNGQEGHMHNFWFLSYWDISKSGHKTTPFLFYGNKVVGYYTRYGKGMVFSIGTNFYSDFNSLNYSRSENLSGPIKLIQAIFDYVHIEPLVETPQEELHNLIWARKIKNEEECFVFIRNYARQEKKIRFRLSNLKAFNLKEGSCYQIKSLLDDKMLDSHIVGKELKDEGINLKLGPESTAVLLIYPERRLVQNQPSKNILRKIKEDKEHYEESRFCSTCRSSQCWQIHTSQ